MKEEEPHKVWQDVQERIQKEEELVGEYIQRFSWLWEDFVQGLESTSATGYDKEGLVHERVKD